MFSHTYASHYAGPGELDADALQATAAQDYQGSDARHGRYLIMAPLALARSGHYGGAEILSAHHSPEKAREALATAQRRLTKARNRCRRTLARYAGPHYLALVDGADRAPIEWAEVPGAHVD